MDIRFPESRQLLDKVHEQFRKGLWPYTPDPAPVGLLEISAPPSGTPLIVEGNSRHALGRLRRVLLPIGGRALVVETGGRDLYTALADETLRMETVVAAVEEVALTGEIPTSSLPEALLPYPIYQAWDEEELNAAGIGAGPTNPEDLPVFLANGQNLTEEMKRYCCSLRERLHLILAHAALLLLVALGPLLYIGTEAVGVGVALVLSAATVSALLLSNLQKWGSRRSRWFLVATFTLLFGVLVATTLLLMGHELERTAVLCGAALVAGGWLVNLGVSGERGFSTVELFTDGN